MIIYRLQQIGQPWTGIPHIRQAVKRVSLHMPARLLAYYSKMKNYHLLAECKNIQTHKVVALLSMEWSAHCLGCIREVCRSSFMRCPAPIASVK